MRRVVITGLGIVCPVGNSVPEAWERTLACSSGVDRISLFDPSDLPVQIAAEVRDFEPTTVMDAKEARQSSRFVQFAAGAANEAIQDSGLDVAQDPERYGISVGVGLGGFSNLEEGAITLKERGHRRISPLLIPYTIPNMAAGFVSVAHGLKGPNLCTATACTSATNAIGEAYLHIALGLADVMVSGGSEAATTPLSVAAFARMKALSPRNDAPGEASRPFDADRDGFIMGEGSGMLILEEYEHARQRRAKVYGELAGYGMSGDAYHITSPPPGGEGAQRCMKAALQMAQLNPEDVDYINAHGTSTQANDAEESAAISAYFGEHAKKVSISSTKGVTGHCLGAAGAIEAVLTAKAVAEGIVPPTANYTTPDPNCPLDYTPREPRQRTIDVAISNSFGFGGHNATIVIKRLAE